MSYPIPTPRGPSVADATLKSTDALPDAASATVGGTPIDLGPITGISARSEKVEALLSVPALTTVMLPDAKTMTYSIEAASDSAFTNPITLAGSCIVQTGAGGAGAAANTFRMKIPGNCARYLRAKAVSGALTTDASSLKMTLQLLF
jgi:hypothetical protein